MPEPTKGGPQPGRQRRVEYCPNCKGDIHPIPTNKKKKKDAESHAYLCDCVTGFLRLMNSDASVHNCNTCEDETTRLFVDRRV